MKGCLFCQILAGKVPSKKVYEDELCFAFEDIAPKAPIHYLFIPKEHFASAAEIDQSRERLAGHLMLAAAGVAKKKGLEGGFRLVANTGADAGQTVFHMHVHLMGGRALGAMG